MQSVLADGMPTGDCGLRQFGPVLHISLRLSLRSALCILHDNYLLRGSFKNMSKSISYTGTNIARLEILIKTLSVAWQVCNKQDSKCHCFSAHTRVNNKSNLRFCRSM
jgi:hypothetical protein